MTTKKTILYVEDDEDDREILTDAIRDITAQVEVVLVENGLEAIHYLNNAKQEANDLPCLIVLDINMPYLDGKQTFQHLKQDEALQTVPIIVFSSSQKPDDKTLFNNLGIEYIVKPLDIHHMNTIAHHMVSFCCRS